MQTQSRDDFIKRLTAGQVADWIECKYGVDRSRLDELAAKVATAVVLAVDSLMREHANDKAALFEAVLALVDRDDWLDV